MAVPTIAGRAARPRASTGSTQLKRFLIESVDKRPEYLLIGSLCSAELKCFAALDRQPSISTVVLPVLTGGDLVVSEAGPARPAQAVVVVVGSLTSGFEEREAQAAESWRGCSGNGMTRRDSGQICVFSSHHHDARRAIGERQSVKVPVTQIPWRTLQGRTRNQTFNLRV